MHHSNFVHLHVHTLYSLLDSSIRHEQLFQKAEQYKMSAIAMTDHGNLFGALDFYQKARNHGLKPIIGCEIYIAPEDRREKSEKHGLRDASYHLILLAKNDRGYKNLIKLITLGYTEGFYYKPRIDKGLLSEHAEGLIALSSCNRGEVGDNLYRENLPRAKKVADQYREIMGDDNFYLELQYHKHDWQEKANKELVALGKELSIPVVATNNCHYLEREDARAHEILLCLQTGKTISDQYRMQYPNQEYYFKSPEEMTELFFEIPEAISNTMAIAERCNFDFDLEQTNLPDYPVPEGQTLTSYLGELSESGLQDRFESFSRIGKAIDVKTYEDRLKEELRIIQSMGYPGYFLIVWDFIHYAQKKGIPVGPGRGSSAGSLVAYALRITDIDPIEYGLLFERFLNPERVSLPDIDIDFCMERREEVIAYVTSEYGGSQNVTQIITFGSMNAKAVIRDVGRVLDMPYGDVDKIAKLVPNRLGISLKEAFKEEKGFEEIRKKNEKVNELLEIAVNLEGLPRHCSTHAAGVVISSKPLTDFLPLYKGGNDEIVTQFSMTNVEKLGLLKMDFLGLKTLTVIDNALKLLQRDGEVGLEMNSIPKDDPETFKLLRSAKAVGIFQLESSGMRDLLKKMKPDCFEDIIALLALYRPGPLESGMVDDYIKCKHGHQQVKYALPQLEDILSETHGVILYQEQVMKIASVLAGFTLGDADLLRRAMGKKKPEEMAQQREKFQDGCKEKRIPEKKAQTIFNLMEKFAGYGFNKSHSAAYALVSYQTAYLKAHHPLEFFGALITADMDNTDKVIRYINDCREMDIEVLPPDVNESFWDFTIARGKLLFGLGAIKNVGSSAIESILETRKEEGPFRSFREFCERIDLRSVNRRVIESLIKSGALDSLRQGRADMIQGLSASIEQAHAKQKDMQVGQSSMFEVFEDDLGETGSVVQEVAIEWTDYERLKNEKETLGFYITGHPLVDYKKEIACFTDTNSSTLGGVNNGKVVSVSGLPSKVQEKTTRKGDKMGFITLEDLQGTLEVTLFPETFSLAESFLNSEKPLLINGKVEADENSTKLIAQEVYPLSEARRRWKGKVSIDLRTVGLEKGMLIDMKKVLSNYPGNSDVHLYFTFPNNRIKVVSVGPKLRIEPSEEAVSEIEALIGEDSVRFQKF